MNEPYVEHDMVDSTGEPSIPLYLEPISIKVHTSSNNLALALAVANPSRLTTIINKRIYEIS